jgi:putative chitinase
MGNGDEKSQEGYFFRGRGALQTTGKINYLAFSKFIKDPKIMKHLIYLQLIIL